MPCYQPITGYRTANGSVVFTELKRHGTSQTITVKCGQCIGCRLERSRQWAMRCVHEASLYKRNCFITLTYNDENLPHRGQLTHRDFQLFIKRLRKHAKGTHLRYYMGGEYGTENWRPHYHAIIFNWDWDDKKYFKTTGSGEKIYTSTMLAKLWPYGHSSTGDATFESAAYIARYCLQKITGPAADAHYARKDDAGNYQLLPEYNEPSNGIGADWFHFYKAGIKQSDSIVIRGVETNIPKYYDKLLKRNDPDKMRDFKEEREWKGYQVRHDNTPERLEVKRQVTEAKISQLKRGKI